MKKLACKYGFLPVGMKMIPHESQLPRRSRDASNAPPHAANPHSNSTLASNRLNWPSTGTFICWVTKRIELFAGMIFCCAAAGKAASAAAATAGRIQLIGAAVEGREACG